MIQVQLGHPKIAKIAVPVFTRVSDVFLELFRCEEESVYIYWRGIPVRLRYREDLSRNFNSILAMVWMVANNENGGNRVQLENELLTVTLDVRWRGHDIELQAAYLAKHRLHRAYAGALNQLSTINLAVESFLSEWKTLLHQIVVSFQAGKVVIKEGTERRKWEMLQQTEQSITGIGSIYRRVK